MNTISDALLQLYKDLRNAYWYASSIDDKDRIAGLADAVYELNNAILQGQIVKNDEVFDRESDLLTSTIAALKRASDDIDRLVKQVGIAAKIASGLARALALLA